MKLNNKKEKNVAIVILCIVFIGFINSIPFIFFNELYFQHDYIFHISRMEAYLNSVRQLDFFPKIFYEYLNGGGYAVDLFYPSIMLMPYVVFRLIGFSIARSLGLFYFVMNCSVAGSSFLLGRTLFKNFRTSLLLSLLYTGSTYRFCDEIVRGAVGEVFGFIFIPIAFIGLYQVAFGDKKKWYWLAIGMACLLLTHLLSAYMFFFFILLFFVIKLILERDIQDFIERISVLIFTGISTVFLVMWHLSEIIQQIMNANFNLSGTFLSYPSADFKTIVKQSLLANISQSGSTTNVGTFLIVALFVAWLFFFSMNKYYQSLLVVSTALVFMTSSSFPWKFLARSPLKMMQFPFRLNLFSTLFIIMIIAYIFENRLKSNKIFFFIIASVCTILSLNLNFSYTPKETPIASSEELYKDSTSLGGGQEYLIKGYNYRTIVPKNGTEINVINNEEDTFTVSRDDHKLVVEGTASKATEIVTPFLYYYGYKAIDADGKEILCKELDGRVAFTFPKGSHSVVIQYKKTKIQIITSFLSIVSLFIFLCYIFFSNYQLKMKEKPKLGAK